MNTTCWRIIVRSGAPAIPSKRYSKNARPGIFINAFNNNRSPGSVSTLSQKSKRRSDHSHVVFSPPNNRFTKARNRQRKLE